MDDSIKLTIDSISKVGLAVHQNGVSVIRSITVTHSGVQTLRDHRVVVTSDPEFFTPVSVEVSEVPPGETVELHEISPCLSHTFLSSITEQVAGSIKVAFFNSESETPVAEIAKPVDIGAHDDWFGGEFMPEMLAAFVTPNSAAVAKLLGRVAELIKERTDSGALDGYQRGDKSCVLMMLKCIYDAVLECGVNYAEPPASFGTSGQRVRFPDQIVKQGFATCLDFSLLVAGMLEQCGLNPLIVLNKGHAYVGCHLLNFRFPDAIVDDLQSIRKRVELDEISVVETTLAAGSQSKFSIALAAGVKHLSEDDEFIYALDVRQARAIGIRPLSGVVGLGTFESFQPSRPVETDEELPCLDDTPRTDPQAVSPDVPSRVVRWRSKLLDLSRRNRLLNFKDSKQSIPMALLKFDTLEDKLAAGDAFSILARPTVFGEGSSDSRNLSQIERDRGEDSLVKYLTEEFDKKRLRSFLDEKELDKRLTELYRQSRTDIEEGGVNTLFIAMGFLKWVDGSGASANEYKAPLLLLPIQLERQSAKSGYTLKRADEDAVVNVTLLEMLRRDFGRSIEGLDPPPFDDSGLDVQSVMRIFRQAILDIKGWEVVDELWIGRLFFSKFIMWDDLNRRLADLSASPIVSHLIRGAGSFDDGVVAIRPDEVDTCIKPQELFCPLSADASQLSAVLSAARGKNFVLHGPPGTGKSQTITNVIAYCLAEGKTVLFVAEKRAALEVVQRRLKKIGLAPFCLELHSNKAGKTDVLNQFAESISFGSYAEPATWAVAIQELESTRDSLTGYVSAMHKQYPCGLTPFRALSYLFAHVQDEALVEGVSALNEVKLAVFELERLSEAARELTAQASGIAPQLFDDFSCIRPTQWSPVWERAALDAATEMQGACSFMQTQLQFLSGIVGLETSASFDDAALAATSRLAQLLFDFPVLPTSLFCADWPIFSSTLAHLVLVGEKASEVAQVLAGFELDAVASFDVVAMRKRLAETAERSIITRMIRYGKARKDIAACLRPGSDRKITKRDLQQILNAFELYTSNRQAVLATKPDVLARLNGHYAGLESDWTELRLLLAKANDLYSVVRELTAGSVETLPRVCDKLGTVVSASSRGYTPLQMQGYVHAYAEFRRLLDTFRKVVGFDDTARSERAGVIVALGRVAESVLRHAQHLRRWCLWNQVRSRCIELKIGSVVSAVESGDLELDHVQLALRKRYYERFISDVIDTVPELRNFLGHVHDGLVEKFSHVDAEVETLSQNMIIAKLSQRLPLGRSGECPSTSELGILKRECEKKSRHRPVRTLLESIPTILPLLKPCMLMSPLSVAQYLPPGSKNFDIIVFDEASQITVWDAIGAMARGKQVVIVGDPKQLPPTTFFQRLAEEEEIDDSDIEEMESILDECKASGVSDLHLLWHYRSRHESLIAFSNHNYYGDRLMTFPSSVRESRSLGVSFVFVEDGIYDKSKTRTNRKEAEKIVAAVVERLLDPTLAKKSTGIVTFSQAQQSLIEDLMDEERRKHPEIEKFFAEDIEEPCFVKNLENVQGDERDAIYFSICYGQDLTGSFAMNFGPLNRPGGERRLNVAVTRAKEKVVVFSSINSSQIDTGRTQATGAVHLKSFLEYAERGNNQSVFATRSGDAVESDFFGDEVAEFLRCHGYAVDRHVGCSGYRIDLSVKDTQDEGKYAIGIECDGAQYFGTASARDRDKLRRIVLEGLGWRLVRVWSASWWFDRNQAERSLLDEVEAAVHGLPPPTSGNQQFVSLGVGKLEKFEPSFQCEGPNEFEKVYKAAKVVDGYAKSQSNFNLQFGPQIIGEQMRRIVNEEGPILDSLLRVRIIKEWGFSRIGSTMNDVLERSVPKTLPLTKQFGERVFWPEGMQPEGYQFYRVPGVADESRRTIKQIPVVELANAMSYVLNRFQGIPQEALYTETARLFGFGRITESSRPYYEEANKRVIKEE